MTTLPADLKAPFPAFGGKGKVVDLVWERLGNPRNYIEPFAFSTVMLIRRPKGPGPIETINDLNCFVANFWRAIAAAPDEVAAFADGPVNETDLHARHRWLVQSKTANNELDRVRSDPEYFNAKIAGWWCWGACCWIGSGWCDSQQLPHMNGGKGVNRLSQKLPHMDEGRGVELSQQIPDLHSPSSNGGVNKRPSLCNGNTSGAPGVNRRIDQTRPNLHASNGVVKLDQKRPIISADGSAYGLGINGEMGSFGEKIPTIERVVGGGKGVNGIGCYDVDRSAGTCATRREWITNWFRGLADRLRPVRVCCGHWARVCDSPSTLTRLGTTGVFLDPPYRKHLGDGTKNRSSNIYANDKIQDVGELCDEVQAWCLKWGDDPEIRIALCGLEGEYPKLEHWGKVSWKSNGGYGNQSGDVNENAARERIWFSPHCVKPELGGLFSSGGAS